MNNSVSNFNEFLKIFTWKIFMLILSLKFHASGQCTNISNNPLNMQKIFWVFNFHTLQHIKNLFQWNFQNYANTNIVCIQTFQPWNARIDFIQRKRSVSSSSGFPWLSPLSIVFLSGSLRCVWIIHITRYIHNSKRLPQLLTVGGTG